MENVEPDLKKMTKREAELWEKYKTMNNQELMTEIQSRGASSANQENSYKYNSAVAENRNIRHKIDALRKEKVIFDKIYKKLEKELKHKKDQMKAAISQAEQVCREREATKEEIQQIKLADQKEEEEYQRQCELLNQYIEKDKQVRDYIKTKQKLENQKSKLDSNDKSKSVKHAVKNDAANPNLNEYINKEKSLRKKMMEKAMTLGGINSGNLESMSKNYPTTHEGSTANSHNVDISYKPSSTDMTSSLRQGEGQAKFPWSDKKAPEIFHKDDINKQPPLTRFVKNVESAEEAPSVKDLKNLRDEKKAALLVDNNNKVLEEFQNDFDTNPRNAEVGADKDHPQTLRNRDVSILGDFVNEVQAEVDQLDKEIEEISRNKVLIDIDDENTRKVSQKLQDDLKKAKEVEQDYINQVENSDKTINALKLGINSITSTMGIDHEELKEILGSHGVTESNMMQYLGVVEKKTNELIDTYTSVMKLNNTKPISKVTDINHKKGNAPIGYDQIIKNLPTLDTKNQNFDNEILPYKVLIEKGNEKATQILNPKNDLNQS